MLLGELCIVQAKPRIDPNPFSSQKLRRICWVNSVHSHRSSEAEVQIDDERIHCKLWQLDCASVGSNHETVDFSELLTFCYHVLRIWKV